MSVQDAGDELAAALQALERANGFAPNSLYGLGARPEIALQLLNLANAVMRSPTSTVDAELKWLVAHLCSRAHGCAYCSAHALKNSERNGVSQDKLDAIWEYAQSPLFSEAERAAFAVALGSGTSPTTVTDADMDELRRHFPRSRSSKSSAS